MQVKSLFTHHTNCRPELCLEGANSAVGDACFAQSHLQALEITHQANIVPQTVLIITSKQRTFPPANNGLRRHIQEVPRVATGANGPSATDTAKRAAQATVRVNIVVHLDRTSTDIETLIVNRAAFSATAVKKACDILVSFVACWAGGHATAQMRDQAGIYTFVAF